MLNEIEDLINQLKVTHGVETDEELAKSLQIGRSTISSWRIRGSVPKRYLLRRPGDPQSVANFAPTEWGEEDQAAFTLAMLRFVRQHSEDFASYRRFLEDGHMAAAGFWELQQKAKREILAELREYEQVRNASPWNVMTWLAHDDFFGAAKPE